MKSLTLDEKISLKGELSQKILPSVLINLKTSEAISLYWFCFGVPVSFFNTNKKFRKSFKKQTLH